MLFVIQPVIPDWQCTVLVIPDLQCTVLVIPDSAMHCACHPRLAMHCACHPGLRDALSYAEVFRDLLLGWQRKT